jgi:RecG-like helicase
VEDIAVPPHKESNYASAEAEPFNVPNNCIGVIHSHHTMGAFHSGTDQTHVDRNFPVSITVAKQSDNLTYDAVSVQTTPCGKTVSLKGEVKYVQPKPTFDEDEWLKVAKENIDKGQYKGVYAGQVGVQSNWVYKDGHLVEVKKEALPETVVKSTVTMEEVCKTRQRIQEAHGVELTRSEIEDAMDALDLESKLGVGWGVG